MEMRGRKSDRARNQKGMAWIGKVSENLMAMPMLHLLRLRKARSRKMHSGAVWFSTGMEVAV
jgi:hypothetical protein